MDKLEFRRNRYLRRVEKMLVRTGSPRFQMSLMILLTALSGFMASFLLLSAGIKWMWLRYPLAVLAAYAVFLFLIWCWLKFYRKKFHLDPDTGLPNVSLNSSGSGHATVFEGVDGGASIDTTTFQGFEGGSSGGGGAGGSFGGDSTLAETASSSNSTGFSLDFDADELILVLVVLGVALLAAVIAVMMITSAPSLFGEVLLDGAVATGIYRRMKKVESRNWLESVFNRTWLSILGLILFFAAAGWVFHWYAPKADSIGDVWRYFRSS